jgi:hypothetical protein
MQLSYQVCKVSGPFRLLLFAVRVYNPSILSPSTRCSLPECRWQGSSSGALHNLEAVSRSWGVLLAASNFG